MTAQPTPLQVLIQSDLQDAEDVQLLRPRLTLTFSDILAATYSHLTVSGPSVSRSLEKGVEAALKGVLEDFKLDLHRINPVVECFLSLRDVRLSRGMAGGSGINGQIDSAQLARSLEKARTAAADVSPGWAGTRIWGDVSEIVIDGTPFDTSTQDRTLSGTTFRVEVLEAFYVPDVESVRNALLRGCGLNSPTWQHLSIVNYAEAFTTRSERQAGIATVHIDRLGAEIAVSIGGHIVALGSIAATGGDPFRSLCGADIWLTNNRWNFERLPHGIRLLGNGFSRDWFSPFATIVSMPVSFLDDAAVVRSLQDEVLCRHSASKSIVARGEGFSC